MCQQKESRKVLLTFFLNKWFYLVKVRFPHQSGSKSYLIITWLSFRHNDHVTTRIHFLALAPFQKCQR
jgi:hypothetical protein